MDRLDEAGLAGLSGPSLGRRGFVMTGLVTGFTIATTRVDAQAIHTSDAGLMAGPISIPVADGAIPGYAARPQGAGPLPIVLVIEEIFGVHEYIRDICRRLAHAGYLAVAPELYARLADLSKMSDAQAIVRDVIMRAPDATVMADLDHAATWAHTHDGDPERLFVTGFCRGGRDTWLYAAHNPDLKAAVAWYGPVGGPTSDIQPHTATALATTLRCPLLGLYGAKDPINPVADVEAAAKAGRSVGRTIEIVMYPDAGHGFHADYRPSYNKADAEDGWRRMLAWFKQYGA